MFGGPTNVCAGSSGNLYEAVSGMTNYLWGIPGSATITAGGTTSSNSVTLTWNTAGTFPISLNYTDANGCTAATPSSIEFYSSCSARACYQRTILCLCRYYRCSLFNRGWNEQLYLEYIFRWNYNCREYREQQYYHGYLEYSPEHRL